jgi:hypothetical protein
MLMRITLNEVDALCKKLDALPDPNTAEREVSKQEAVALMANQVRQLQARGYSMEAVAQFINSQGLKISVQTLKSYLSRARRTKTNKPRRKKTQPVDAAKDEKRKPESPSMTRELKPSKNRIMDKNQNEIRSSGFTPREDLSTI